MKCVFIGNPVPHDFLVKTTNSNFSIADNIAQNCIIDGLYREFGNDLSIVSVAANFDNPHILNKYTKQQKVKLDCGAKAIGVGNLNYNKPIYYLSIIFTYTTQLFKLFHKEKMKNKDSKFLVISGGPYLFTSLPILLARCFYKICFIPFLIGSVELPEYKGIFKLISKLTPHFMKAVDASITYVEQSSKDYTNKPYLAIIYSLDSDKIEWSNECEKHEKCNKKFTILYTGALTKIKGVDKIIQVIKATGLAYHWIVCGNGEYELEIKTLSESMDFDVDFLGLISNRDVIKLQHEADLLIALQAVDTETYKYYSKYAASGKLIEYLLSGTPILTAKLENISEKIRPFLNYLDNQEIETIVNKLYELSLNSSKSEVMFKAKMGRQFVIDKANNSYQNKQIICFIKRIFCDKYHD
ncbi:MAG: glycosyltransferase [Erysipelotrichaceae bacterium]